MSVAAARPIRTYVDLCVRTYARYTYLVAVDRLTDTIDIQTAVTHRYKSSNPPYSHPHPSHSISNFTLVSFALTLVSFALTLVV